MDRDLFLITFYNRLFSKPPGFNHYIHYMPHFRQQKFYDKYKSFVDFCNNSVTVFAISRFTRVLQEIKQVLFVSNLCCSSRLSPLLHSIDAS